MPLPEPPKLALDVVADRSAERDGFLTLRRYQLVLVDDRERAQPFPYDMVERRALDAAVIVAHYLDETGRVHVYLRSSLRPPLFFRGVEPKPHGVLWEVPAGLIEPGESPQAGAARELEEELGFAVAEERLLALGPPVLPAPAFIAELQFFFHVRVDPKTRSEPKGDGSPVEHGAQIVSLSLDEALLACRRGELPDTKTELALRRLDEILRDGKA